MLTLSEAIKTGRLSEFIEEREKEGIGPANRRKFDALVKRATKAPKPQDRTSGSRGHGGSSGKKTP